MCPRHRGAPDVPTDSLPRRPVVAVEQQVDLITAVAVDMAVDIVGFRTGYPRRQRAGHDRPVARLRTEAVIFRERDGRKRHLIAAVATGAAVDAGNHHALAENLRHLSASGDLQLPARRQRRAAGSAAQPGLVVQVALVAQTGIKRPALRLRVALAVTARRQVVIRPVIRLTVGGDVAGRHVRALAHLLRRVAVVVIPGEHRLLHHFMLAFQLPHRLGTAVVLAGGRHRRQNQPLLVVPLVIVKLHHVNVQPGVGGEAEPDTDLAQQAGDKAQVVLAVLHHLLATRIRLCQGENKVLPAHGVAGTAGYAPRYPAPTYPGKSGSGGSGRAAPDEAAGSGNSAFRRGMRKGAQTPSPRPESCAPAAEC